MYYIYIYKRPVQEVCNGAEGAGYGPHWDVDGCRIQLVIIIMTSNNDNNDNDSNTNEHSESSKNNDTNEHSESSKIIVSMLQYEHTNDTVLSYVYHIYHNGYTVLYIYIYFIYDYDY